MLRSALIRFPFLFLPLLAACSQAENEPCQLDGDCDTGLICLRAPASERGTCENPKTIQPDAGAAQGDAGQPPLPDAGNDDAGSEDAGASQSGAEDAG